MKCEQTIQHTFQGLGKTHKSKCGKEAVNVDEAQRGLCPKHFKKWHIKKFGYEFEPTKQ